MKYRLLIFLLPIILLSGFLRFYRLESKAGFDYDQEVAAYSARRILSGKLTLVGQETSIKGVFVGPCYNYILAFLLFFSRGDPMIIFIFQTILGIITTTLLFYLGERLNPMAGLFAAFLYAISNRFIQIDQSSTPSNGLIFLTTLAFWIAFQAKLSANLKMIFCSSIAGFASQMHPAGLVLLVIPAVLLYKSGNKKIISIFSAIVSFLFWFIPLIIFDLRHDFFILRGIFSFETPVYYSLLFRLIILSRTALTAWFITLIPIFIRPLYLIIFLFILSFILTNKSRFNLLKLTLFSSPLLFSFLPVSSPEYYLFPSFIAFLLLFSIKISSLFHKSFINKVLIIVFLLIVMVLNIKTTLNSKNNYPVKAKKSVIQFIKSNSYGKKVIIFINSDIGQSYGFSYLLDWLGVDYIITQDNPDFVINIPYENGENSVVFDAIGVKRTTL